jgi:peptide/nickel transport system substrate-binding protein
MGIAWWGPAFPDPSYYLAFNPGQLVGLRSGWDDGKAEAIEALAMQASQAVVQEERDAVYREWQMAMNEGGPFIPLFQPPTTIVSSKEITGVAFHPTWTVDLAEVRPAE